MKALISPTEQIYKYDGTLLGARIAQIDPTGFDIAEPLFWVDCEDTVVPDQYYYSEGLIQQVPIRPVSNT